MGPAVYFRIHPAFVRVLSEMKVGRETSGFSQVCHPRGVCENWKVYVVKHNYVN